MTARVILSKAGFGGQGHFDADCTFNLQLQGEKRWQVAQNESVSYPHRPRLITERMIPDMERYAAEPFPARMPSGGTRFTAKAGSVDYLPHGCWRATTCRADSFSLLFVLAGPKWYELFSREIEAELIQWADARRISLIGAPGAGKSAAKILARLKAMVSRMDADRLVERWRGVPPTTFRKSAAGPRVVSNNHLQATLRWLKTAPETFDAADVVDALPHRRPFAVLKDLSILVRLNVLEIAVHVHSPPTRD